MNTPLSLEITIEKKIGEDVRVKYNPDAKPHENCELYLDENKYTCNAENFYHALQVQNGIEFMFGKKAYYSELNLNECKKPVNITQDPISTEVFFNSDEVNHHLFDSYEIDKLYEKLGQWSKPHELDHQFELRKESLTIAYPELEMDKTEMAFIHKIESPDLDICLHSSAEGFVLDYDHVQYKRVFHLGASESHQLQEQLGNGLSTAKAGEPYCEIVIADCPCRDGMDDFGSRLCLIYEHREFRLCNNGGPPEIRFGVQQLESLNTQLTDILKDKAPRSQAELPNLETYFEKKWETPDFPDIDDDIPF